MEPMADGAEWGGGMWNGGDSERLELQVHSQGVYLITVKDEFFKPLG